MSEPDGLGSGTSGLVFGVRATTRADGQGRGRRRASTWPRCGSRGCAGLPRDGRAAACWRSRSSARTSRTCCPPPAPSCCARATRSRSRSTEAGDRGQLREPQRAAGRAPGRGPRLAAGDRRRRGAAARVPRRVRVPGRALRAATGPAGPSRRTRTPPGRSPAAGPQAVVRETAVRRDRPGRRVSPRHVRARCCRSRRCASAGAWTSTGRRWRCEHGWRIGVVDATPIRHGLRRIAASYDRDEAIAEARRVPRRPPVHRRRRGAADAGHAPVLDVRVAGRRRVLPPRRRTRSAASGRTARRSPHATPAPTCGCSCCTGRAAAVGGPLRPRSGAALARGPRSRASAELDGLDGAVRALPVAAAAAGAIARWGAWAAPLLAPRAAPRAPAVRVRPGPRPLRGPRRATRSGARRRSVPLVVSVHGDDVHGARAGGRAVRATLAHARLVLANSAGTAGDRAALGARAHAGRAPRRRRPAGAPAARPRTPTLVTVAHLAARKRHADVIAALAAAARRVTRRCAT